MPSVTSTVGPGKTYATLAAWAAGRAGSLVSGTDEIANCFSGSDLGGCTVTWNNGLARTQIIADVSSRHNGKDAGHTGVAYSTGPIQLDPGGTGARATVQNMRLENYLHLGTTQAISRTDTAKNNLFVIDTPPVPGSVISIFSSGEDGNAPTVAGIIVNNIIYFRCTTGSGINIIDTGTVGDGLGDSVDLIVTIDNNTVLSTAAGGVCNAGISVNIDIESTGSAATVRNNISMSGPASTADFSIIDNSGVATITNLNNMSSDDSATSFGTPSGSFIEESTLPNQVITHMVNDATLSSSSPAKNHGTSAPGASASPDAVGVTRPQGAAWDIGALELVPPTAVARAWRAVRFWSHP